MKKALFFSFLLLFCLWSIAQNPSTIQETKRVFTTYPFSDPNPVAKPANIIYPYFRFEGYSAKGVDKEWKVVELENDYIKLSIFPEIGGKLWGAVEKSTRNEFLYFNHSVKFRDIAMRGPWTSGGIEFNFGIIGHAPTASTPVDYLMKTNADGSVSCFISAIELITRTMWSVEVNLPKDKAYFTTKTIYYNSSSVEKPYYHWMNAGYKARGNLEFCFPGQYQIGHGGEVYPFPINEAGRNISWYENNNFGTSKSYHVVGKYNDFYAAYWHDADFGSAHYAPYDEKPGMKIFLWGLCREGGIWEGLLTDTDGQYVELQSGRMYNQAASNSVLTPYKLFPFMPLSTDSWTEYWFPIKGTEGVSKVSPLGALNVIRKNGHLEILFCPLQKIVSKITVSARDTTILTKELNLNILEPWKESILIDQIPAGPLRIVLGDNELVYSENPVDNNINRPSVTPENFDWNSVYGLYLEGEQWLNYKAYDKAEIALKKCLDLDPNYLPALNKMASISYRRGHYKDALDFCKTSLSINAYDGMANYLYGLINTEIGEYTDAKDGFSVASYSMEVRSAAYSKLAQRYLFDKDWTKAEHYALKSLNFNSKNFDAVQVLMIVYRKSNLQEKAKILIADALKDLPLNHYVRFEAYLLNPTEDAKAEFTSMVRNEFPYETYIELAGWYESVGCWDEALRLLSFASEYPVALYRTAYILHKQGKQSESLQVLTRANALSPFLVFPFRIESLNALVWALKEQPDWKINYYIALIYWNNGDTVKALDLLNTCEKVDYAPFYMSRALLKTGTDQLNDLLLSEKLEPGWRVGLGLINYYLQVDDKTNACQIASKYYTKYPNNYMIGLKYAKALCLNQKYTESLHLLTKLVVLPNEGSYEGRTVYRDANLYQSIAYLNKKQYARARQAVEKSELWIENLGVGKPYDRDIDNRLENFILACIYQKQGNKSEANRYLEKICAGYVKDQVSFNSNDYLTALALRETGNAKEADYLMSNWMKKQPDSKIFQWCNAMYNNEEQKAGKLFSERYNLKESIIPWETVRNDYNFNVIVELLKVI